MAASRLRSFGKLVPELDSALRAFQSSDANFRIFKTIHPSFEAPQEPSRPPQGESPKTLFILDSSFNPPSIAHRTLAQSALEKSASDKFTKPHRLLLLFAIMNADKAPSPASFEQRLALMTVFAKDLQDSLKQDSQKFELIPIDIGVTKLPYYTDKSRVIETEGQEWYPDKPHHIHLVGYDTLTRFFGAKYYKEFDPPFAALNPYFDAGHRLRVTLRPDEEYGTVDTQKAFAKKLETGEMAKDGGKPEWAKQVELVPPNAKAGVSSTKIRKAAKAGDWETVKQLCTPGVAEWVQQESLYEGDDRGAKMA
ncbi:putative nicotinate/nicotinamide nucleotide adenylyltransferase [Septoria linicola]|nr:putative nicotinate/nicotinamide nucleotide adenylyltransferase [Septoria linicola]